MLLDGDAEIIKDFNAPNSSLEVWYSVHVISYTWHVLCALGLPASLSSRITYRWAVNESLAHLGFQIVGYSSFIHGSQYFSFPSKAKLLPTIEAHFELRNDGYLDLFTGRTWPLGIAGTSHFRDWSNKGRTRHSVERVNLTFEQSCQEDQRHVKFQPRDTDNRVSYISHSLPLGFNMATR